MLLVVAGLLAGALHVVSGPDHLAALAPLALRDRPRAAAAGARWGLGHGLGVLALGLLGQAARGAASLEDLSAWSEFLVGWALVGIGLWTLRSLARLTIHAHPHGGGDPARPHAHLHVHQDARAAGDHSPEAHVRHSHAPLLVGALHGAAGGGHLLGVLPSLALSPAGAAIYLASYLAGAVASMAAFGLLLGWIAGRGGPRLLRGLLAAAAAASVLVGAAWIVAAWPLSA